MPTIFCLEMMSEAIGLSLRLVLVLRLFEFLGGFAINEFLDGEVVAAFVELAAVVDAFVFEVDVEDVLTDALFVLVKDHTDLVIGHCLFDLFHRVRVYAQVPLDADLHVLPVLQFQGLVLHHFLFEVVEGGFRVEEAGF